MLKTKKMQEMPVESKEYNTPVSTAQVKSEYDKSWKHCTEYGFAARLQGEGKCPGIIEIRPIGDSVIDRERKERISDLRRNAQATQDSFIRDPSAIDALVQSALWAAGEIERPGCLKSAEGPDCQSADDHVPPPYCPDAKTEALTELETCGFFANASISRNE